MRSEWGLTAIRKRWIEKRKRSLTLLKELGILEPQLKVPDLIMIWSCGCRLKKAKASKATNFWPRRDVLCYLNGLEKDFFDTWGNQHKCSFQDFRRDCHDVFNQWRTRMTARLDWRACLTVQICHFVQWCHPLIQLSCRSCRPCCLCCAHRHTHTCTSLSTTEVQSQREICKASHNQLHRQLSALTQVWDSTEFQICRLTSLL